MKIYQVGTRDVWSEHQGYTYHTVKSEAIKAFNKSQKKLDSDLIVRELKLNKKSILTFLNAYCSHPDNG